VKVNFALSHAMKALGVGGRGISLLLL